MSWNEYIHSLFDEDCLNYEVDLVNGQRVRYVNLDNAATTSPFKEVRDMVNTRLNTYGSVHRGAGQKSQLTTREYDATRDKIRNFVGAAANKYVIFAKNTTEAINHSAVMMAKIPGKILVSDIEHSSNLLPWVVNDKVLQFRTRTDGSIDLEEVERLLREAAKGPVEDRIKLITSTGASTITGYKPPIHDLARLAHQYGARMFADVCQLIQHDNVNCLSEDDPGHLDFVAFSGHKMYAPYGTGVLLGPKDIFDRFFPYQIGGGNLPYITSELEIKRFYIERAHDPGTPNVMGALSISRAIDVINRIGRERIAEHEKQLVCYTLDRLRSMPGVVLYISGENPGHVIPFDLRDFDGRLVAEILADEHGIGLRAGSFCTYEYIRKLKGLTKQDDQQIAAEVDRKIVRNVPTIIRASFALYNTIEDCDRFLAAISEILSAGLAHYLKNYRQDQTTGVFCRIEKAHAA